MVEIKTIFYSLMLIGSGLFFIFYTLKYAKKGQIRFPSIWDRKPHEIKSKPFIYTPLVILQFTLGLIGFIVGIMLLMYGQ